MLTQKFSSVLFKFTILTSPKFKERETLIVSRMCQTIKNNGWPLLRRFKQNNLAGNKLFQTNFNWNISRPRNTVKELIAVNIGEHSLSKKSGSNCCKSFSIRYRNSRQEVFCKKAVLQNLGKCRGKHLY